MSERDTKPIAAHKEPIARCEICGEPIPVNMTVLGGMVKGEYRAIHLWHEGSPEYENWMEKNFDGIEQFQKQDCAENPQIERVIESLDKIAKSLDLLYNAITAMQNAVEETGADISANIWRITRKG